MDLVKVIVNLKQHCKLPISVLLLYLFPRPAPFCYSFIHSENEYTEEKRVWER